MSEILPDRKNTNIGTVILRARAVYELIADELHLAPSSFI